MPSWASRRVIPVSLSSLWGCSQKVLASKPLQSLKQWAEVTSPRMTPVSGSIFLNLLLHPVSWLEWHLPGCHLRMTLSFLNYFRILSAGHYLTQVSISILRDLYVRSLLSTRLLGPKHSLLNNSYAAALGRFHPSNPHSPTAFLLIRPATTHSRNTVWTYSENFTPHGR